MSLLALPGSADIPVRPSRLRVKLAAIPTSARSARAISGGQECPRSRRLAERTLRDSTHALFFEVVGGFVKAMPIFASIVFSSPIFIGLLK